MNRTPAGSLRESDVGHQVTLAGWVQKQRDFGDLVFIDLTPLEGEEVFKEIQGKQSELKTATPESKSGEKQEEEDKPVTGDSK